MSPVQFRNTDLGCLFEISHKAKGDEFTCDGFHVFQHWTATKIEKHLPLTMRSEKNTGSDDGIDNAEQSMKHNSSLKLTLKGEKVLDEEHPSDGENFDDLTSEISAMSTQVQCKCPKLKEDELKESQNMNHVHSNVRMFVVRKTKLSLHSMI